MVFTQTLEVTGDMVETEWQDSVLTNRTTSPNHGINLAQSLKE